MNFDFLLAIKFNKLYIFMSENIEQKHVFNVINISLSITSDLNHLMTVTQHFKLIVKLFLKSLISLMISIEINNMKALMKTMKTMILAMTVTVFQNHSQTLPSWSFSALKTVLFMLIFFMTVSIQQMTALMHQTQIYAVIANLTLNQCSFYHVADYCKLQFNKSSYLLLIIFLQINRIHMNDWNWLQ